ncbi:MAG: hypothetical protein DRH07_09935 [Deltaproteobacteria bacterium]|nr:MAG: hypothetical protein DRH07_09935 [Deltaproteobacteria bacterium]
MKFVSLYSLLIFSLLATPAFAKPTAVTLYPNGATISEQTNIAAGSEVVTLLLPNVAIPKSLKLALLNAPGEKISGIEYQSVLPDSSGFQKLRDKISQLEQKIAAVDDQLKSRALALDYWKTEQEFPIKTLADTREMGKIIAEESIVLLQESSQFRQQKLKLEKQLKEAKNQLQQKTGNNQRNWKIEVRLAQPAATKLELAYSYRVRHAGWKSDYTLNALPGKKKVEWIWSAKIIQQTGINWNGIHLKIASTEPVFTLTPPPVRPWEIRERQVGIAPRNMKMKAMVMSQEVAMDAVADKEESMPVRTEGQLFDLYDLGKVDITTGKESQIKIREGLWHAKFTYLSRPLLSEQVFLQANLDLTKDFLPLPTGMASIQVDGVHVGQRRFSLHEKQNVTMSFGSDPGLIVDVKTDHVAGEKGLLSKKYTYSWNWTINFTNNKKIAVDLKVEDSSPHIGHQKITLKESFSLPQPHREKGKLIWNLALPPQGKRQIKYGYSVEYPENMPVSLGR